MSSLVLAAAKEEFEVQPRAKADGAHDRDRRSQAGAIKQVDKITFLANNQ
jgi:hypothetical protein